MTLLIGRDTERKRILDTMAASKRERLPRAVRIFGSPGAGKTALAAVIAEQAAADGWLVASLACHRIRANVPLLLARRTITTLVDVLGPNAERYTGGLHNAHSPSVPAAAGPPGECALCNPPV